MAAKRQEEVERDRRARKDLEEKFQEGIERELNRRKCIALEEQERLRRVAEQGKGKTLDEPKYEAIRQEVLAAVVHH